MACKLTAGSICTLALCSAAASQDDVSGYQLKQTAYGLEIRISEVSYPVQRVGPEQFQARIDAFNEAARINRVSAKIGPCDAMVEIPVGHVGGNSSYGAVCAVTRGVNTRTAKVCNDELVGHFAVADIVGARPDAGDLARFVARNCFGG